MELLKTAGMVLGGIALVAGILGFIYVSLFKANESNMPNASLGVGLCALAGVLKVVLMLAAAKLAPGLGHQWVDYPLIALLVVGMLVMMSGLGEGPK